MALKTSTRHYVLLFVLLVLLGSIWLLTTRQGFDAVVFLARRMVPEDVLHFDHAEGRILQGFEVNQLHFKNHDMTVEAKCIDMAWDPSALFKQRLHVTKLHLDELNIVGATEQPIELNTLDGSGFLSQRGIKAKLSFDAEAPHIRGELAAQGLWQDYQIKLHAISDTFDVSLQGKGDQHQMQLAGDKGKLFGGQLSTQATLAWQKVFAWRVRLTTHNMKYVWPGVAEHSDVSFVLDGHGQGEQLEAKLDQLKGTWRKAPLSGSLQIKQTSMQDMSLAGQFGIGKNNIALEATVVGEKLNADWRLELPRLYDISGDVKGKLSTHGKIVGELQHPIVTGELLANHIATEDMRVRKAAVSFMFDTHQPQHSFVNADLLDAARDSYVVDSTQLRVKGGEKQDSIQIDITKDHQSIHAAVTGKLDKGASRWAGKLTALTVKAPNLSWNLPEATAMTISAKDIEIAPICLHPLQGNLCIGAEWQKGEEWQARLTAEKISGAALAVLLPTGDALHDVKGQFNADFTVHGDEDGVQSLTGAMRLNDLSLKVKPANASFKGGDIHAVAVGDRLNLKVHLQSEKGPLDLKGSLQLKNPITSNLSLLGKTFLAYNTRSTKVVVSPNLRLKGSGPDLQFAGDIHVDEAHMLKKRFSSTVTLPDEITYVHTLEPQKGPPLLNIHGEARLNLGKHFKVNLAGLTGRIEGNLLLKRSNQGLLTATGKCLLEDGKYTAHSQDLTISKGELDFLGDSVSNPRLNIVAERTIDLASEAGDVSTDLMPDSITVGLKVNGTVSNNKISLFSHPVQLSDINILSYLVTGKKSSGSAAGNFGSIAMLALSSFASSSSLSNTMSTTEKLQDSSIVDEFAITSDASGTDMLSDTSGTMVTIGKRLSPKMYLKYRFGITSEDYTLSLNYQLSRHYSTQLYSKQLGSGINLLYRS